MSNTVPQQLLETLVRHKFYSSVDWNRCAGGDLSHLETEFRAILRAIVRSIASDLPDAAKKELEDQIIREVCVEQHIDIRIYEAYRIRLYPKIPFMTRLSNYAKEVLFWVAGEKGRVNKELEALTARFRVREVARK